MSGFVFDFGGGAPEPQAEEEETSCPPSRRWRVEATAVDKELSAMAEEDLSTLRVEGLRYLNLKASALPESECAFAKELTTSDIIKGVYEGGFKLWSCAADLVSFLKNNAERLKGKRVLEAGCGHGLPGIVALQSGADRVVFQDYNVEVLKHLTLPNILMNAESSVLKAEFWSGNWKKLATELPPCAAVTSLSDPFPTPSPAEPLTEAEKADVIVSSDTLYTTAAAESLCTFLESCLSYPDGVVYLASQVFYFGCGGGVVELSSILDRKKGDRRLVIADTKRIEDMMDMERAIVTIRWASAEGATPKQEATPPNPYGAC